MPFPFAIPKAPLHYALRLPHGCQDIFTHTQKQTRGGWIFVSIRGQIKTVRKGSRPADAGSYRRQETMLDGQVVDVLSMFLVGPREVLVIVIVTAVVVWLRVRRRP